MGVNVDAKKYWKKVEETVEYANYIVDNNVTIRETVRYFKENKCNKISKSGLHSRIENILPMINKELYEKVRKVLDKNKEERHMRGGMATKSKYESKKKEE